MEQAKNLVWLIPLFPLIGFLFNALSVTLFGKQTAKKLVAYVAPLMVFLSFGVTVYLTQALLAQPQDQQAGNIVSLFDWIKVGNLHIPFEFRIDPLSMLMCLIVTGVGGLIHVYATGYMADDDDHPRFFTYFNLFIVFMLTLVLSNNLVVMFIGWEGVGLCSYLLIGFWYKEVENSKAGNKAFIVNRIGDVGMLLAMFTIYAALTASGVTGRVFSFDVLLSQQALDIFAERPFVATMIGLFLFLGACGKSAQLPLYFWLPDAMAGPTPVSALIHAATMVTAGVVLVTRTHSIFELSTVAMATMAIVGAATALFAATIAFGQSDIKKVLAYSTVSQLGYMFLACGMGAFAAGMFHVTTHAFFKALLFLASGAVIMAMHHNQDMRYYGGLAKVLKVTFATTFIGWLAIAGAGIPNVFGLAGFYSKDEILYSTYTGNLAYGDKMVLFWVGLVTAALTAFYMTRMMGLTFFGPARWHLAPAHGHGHHDDHHADDSTPHDVEEKDAHGAHADHGHGHGHGHHGTPREPGWSVLAPLCVLAVASFIGGYMLYKPYSIESFLAPVAGHHGKATEVEAGHGGEAGYGVDTHSAPAHSEPAAGEVTGGGHAEGDSHAIHTRVGWMATAAAVLGLLGGLAIYGRRYPKFEENLGGLGGLQRAAGAQWGYDWLATNYIGLRLGAALGALSYWFDRWVVDGAVRGAAFLVGALGQGARTTQTGHVRNYAFTMLIGVIAVIGFVVYVSTRR